MLVTVPAVLINVCDVSVSVSDVCETVLCVPSSCTCMYVVAREEDGDLTN